MYAILMYAIGIIFGLIALLLAGCGVALLSEATFGVGLIAIGAICAIFARLAQADAHHSAWKRELKKWTVTDSDG